MTRVNKRRLTTAKVIGACYATYKEPKKQKAANGNEVVSHYGPSLVDLVESAKELAEYLSAKTANMPRKKVASH